MGTFRDVKMSPELGVDGHGEEAFPCWKASVRTVFRLDKGSIP